MQHSTQPKIRAGITLAAAALFATSSLAQTPSDTCGTKILPGERPQALAQINAGAYTLPPAFAGPTGPYIVPLTFHVVRTSAGTGGIPQAQLDQAILDANAAFAPANIEFCVAGPIDYIDDDFFYFSINGTGDINLLRTTNTVPNTINIYFAENLPGLCGISSFTFSSVQGIAMRNSCTGLPSNPSTFAHELGHYFDLFHTHETFQGAECVNGSNCATAGDLVCDTPADPRVGSSTVSSSCVYTGSATDPCNGSPYNPPVMNLMSYSRKTCRTHFTPGQHARALATLLNLRPELALTICSGGVSEFCSPAVANSTGQPGVLSLAGSGLVANNDLTLKAAQLPAGRFGYFLNGQAQGSPSTPMGSSGNFCLGGAVGRYNRAGEIFSTGALGAFELTVDLTDTPTPSGPTAIMSGETWYFQAWYRDNVSGFSTSNFTNMLSVTFL